MSWISEILDLLNLNQVRLLHWFLRSEANYVESDGLKFEWCDGYIVLSHPRWSKSLTVNKAHVKTFTNVLHDRIGELAHQEARSWN